MSELNHKLNAISELLARRKLEALLLQRVSSFAWATCGAASYINTASTEGTASLLITPDGRYLLTTNIEAPRLEKEEKLAEQGWLIRPVPWHAVSEEVARLAGSLRLGADTAYPGAVDLSADVTQLRSNLTPEEGERFREVGRLSAQAMNEAIRQVRSGMSEYQIAGLLAYAAESRGVQAIVNLVATDERIYNFRHPLPTAKTLGKYAMLVLCGRRYGLVCSLTRLVHFGSLPEELRRKAEAVAHIDAAFLTATRPGRSLGQVFAEAQSAYAGAGFADEWRLHHQGGPAAYEPREVIATPDSDFLIAAGQAYAWNPSITGTKSEDTFLVGQSGNEVISAIEGWPVYTLSVNGQSILRPAILEV
jgi:Xaa-Pro aminopeptidase